MPTQPSKAKERIDAHAKQATDHIDKLLKAQKPEDLQLGLLELKKHIEKIAMDPHSG
jgi:hypothetical protein